MLDAEKVAEGQVPRHQTTPKKSKRGIGLVSPSSGVILTKEQFDCLENIYFSQATDLTESICASDENTRVTISQWFERLEDLRKHKVLYGSAVVTISQDDKLYQVSLSSFFFCALLIFISVDADVYIVASG
jgi:hypothetical protein